MYTYLGMKNKLIPTCYCGKELKYYNDNNEEGLKCPDHNVFMDLTELIEGKP